MSNLGEPCPATAVRTQALRHSLMRAGVVAAAMVVSGPVWVRATPPEPNYQAYYPGFETLTAYHVYWIGVNSPLTPVTPTSGDWITDGYWWKPEDDDSSGILDGLSPSTLGIPGSVDVEVENYAPAAAYILGAVHVAWDFDDDPGTPTTYFPNGNWNWGPAGSPDEERRNMYNLSAVHVDGVYDSGTSTTYPATFTHQTTPIFTGTLNVGISYEGRVTSTSIWAGTGSGSGNGSVPLSYSIGTVQLGLNLGSRGQFDTSADVYASVCVGKSGEGLYNHQSGTLSGLTLDIGMESTGEGEYVMQTGSIAITSHMYVGNQGDGIFTQSAGSATIGGTVTVAHGTGATGTITLGGGTFSANTLNVGRQGIGSFQQQTGEVVAANMFVVGGVAEGASSGGGAGSYTLTTGSLAIGSGAGTGEAYVGMAGGQGTFSQASGTAITVRQRLAVGTHGGSVGTFVQNNGTTSVGTTATAGSLIVGETGGSGTYSLAAGTLSVIGGVTIGSGSGSSGSVVQSGGTHTVTGTLATKTGGASVGNYSLGAGTLSVGSMNNNGTFRQTGGVTTTAAVTGAAGGLIHITGGSFTATGQTTNLGSYNQSGGSVSLAGVTGSGGSMTVAAGTLVADHIRQGSLTVTGGTATGGTINVRANGGSAGLSIVEAISFSGVGTLNVSNNDLIVEYTSSSPLTSVRAAIATAARGADLSDDDCLWNGPGLTSTNAHNLAVHLVPGYRTALGYSEASLYTSRTSETTFTGQIIDSTAVLVLYTYWGDANLDGLTDDSDVDIVTAYYQDSDTPGSYSPYYTDRIWTHGDFNYDGLVDDADVDILASTYDPLGPDLGAVVLSPHRISAAGYARLQNLKIGPVPEPGSLAIPVIVMGCLSARRRR